MTSNADKDEDKLDDSHIADGNVKCFNQNSLGFSYETKNQTPNVHRPCTCTVGLWYPC